MLGAEAAPLDGQEFVLAVGASSVDPVLRRTKDVLSIVGFRVRQVGDTFSMTFGGSIPEAVRFAERLVAAELPLFSEPPLQARVLELEMASEGRRQRLRIPEVDAELSSRLWWTLNEAGNSEPILSFGRVSWRVSIARDGLGGEDIDLLSQPLSDLSLRPGEGFIVITPGEQYAFQLMFRLVQTTGESFDLRFVQASGGLQIFANGPRPFEATFLLTPRAQRDSKIFRQRPTASLTLSSLAVAVGSDLPPRFYIPLASLPTQATDFPVCLEPGGQAPGSSFPLIVLEMGDRIAFPTTGPRSSRAMRAKVRAFLFCGEVGPNVIRWALETFHFVGVAAHSLDILADALPQAVRSQLPRSAGEVSRLDVGDRTIWALRLPSYDDPSFLTGYAAQWDSIERLALDMIATQTGWPPILAAASERRWNSRLPALPVCADVAVAMVATVINRQRGRVGFDDGAEVPDYTAFARPSLWLCAPLADEVRRHEDAISQLILHGVAEYWAASMFSGLGAGDGDGDGDGVSQADLSDLALRFVRAGEQRDSHVSEAMRLDFARASHGLPALEVMTLLTQALLQTFESNLEGHGYLKTYARCINPLVLLIAEGDGSSVNDAMTVSAGYWAAFAAAYSATKPSALVPTLLSRGDLTELAVLHRQLRLLIHGYRANVPDRRADILTARRAIGEALEHMLEPAAWRVLRAAGADRIIAIATVLLDFVPIGDTILGLEVPISRLPISTPQTAFVQLNMVAQSSAAAGDLEGAACVLGPASAEDEAEHWAVEMQAFLRSLMPSLGLKLPALREPQDSARAALESSGIIFFVGHAMASDAWAGLKLGDQWLSLEVMRSVEWTGKIAILIGCETAAIDATVGDIARTLVEHGARAVVGATAKITTNIAQLFLVEFLGFAGAGEAIDYAFFMARRLVVFAEAIEAQGVAWPAAVERAKALLNEDIGAPFSNVLAKAGMTWNEAYEASVYGLSITLLGGGAERIR